MNTDKLAECLREALEELYWPHSNPALRKKCEQALAEYDAQLAQAGNSLLIGTTPDGRPYGLHGTKESVEAVSDLIEAQAALPMPKLNIRCEINDGVAHGTTLLNVIRVEQEDDGSFTAVTNHWPEQAAGVPMFVDRIRLE